jgi:hypothetical protein
MSALINLTPHPVRIYGWDVPDRFDPAEFEPSYVLEPSGTVARIGEIELGTQHLRNCPVPVEVHRVPPRQRPSGAVPPGCRHVRHVVRRLAGSGPRRRRPRGPAGAVPRGAQPGRHCHRLPTACEAGVSEQRL